jgi:hypothetical protein
MLADASKEGRSLIAGYRGELLSWRWESLYTTLSHYVHARGVLAKYWDREKFKSEANVCELLSDVLADPFHEAYTEWAFMFAGLVQKWARWLEGCFCHERELKNAKTRLEKQQLECPWKGKRTPVLAAGFTAVILEDIRGTQTARYAQALLRLPAEAAAGLTLLDQQAREKLCGVLEGKLSYLTKIPYRLVGAWAHFCDPDKYSLESSKAVVRACFEEFDAARGLGRADALVTGLFLRPADLADQLHAFGFGDKDTPLEEFPLAWTEIQERAFATNVERRTERQHVLVKVGTTRGLRYAGPAMTCVRARRKQREEMIDQKDAHMFLLRMWVFSPHEALLAHVLDKDAVRRMTDAGRCARIYQYAEEDHFVEEAETEQAALALTAAADAARAAAVEDSGASVDRRQWLLVDFYKAHLATGTFFSIAEDLYRLALQRSHAEDEEECALVLDEESLAGAVLPKDEAGRSTCTATSWTHARRIGPGSALWQQLRTSPACFAWCAFCALRFVPQMKFPFLTKLRRQLLWISCAWQTQASWLECPETVISGADAQQTCA